MKRLELWFRKHVQSDLRRLWLFFAASVGFYSASYLALNEWSFHRGVSFDGVILPLDYRVPFIPAFIGIYALLYVVPLASFIALLKRRALFSYIAGFYMLQLLHYPIFFFYPVQNLIRPVLAADHLSGALAVCQFFYEIDRPYNLFPSMHVSIVVFSAAFLWRIHHRAAFLFAVLAFLITLSTLFTKQHYILDGAVGALIGATVGGFMAKRSYDMQLNETL